MPYKVIFRQSAEKEFAGLSQGKQKALYDKLKTLESNPTPPDSVELAGFGPLRRIKAGDARAIYDPPDSRGRIFVLRVGDDHDVYQNIGELLDEESGESEPESPVQDESK